IARHMRILMKLKAAMRDGLPGNKLASAAGVSPYFLSGYKRSCGFFTLNELKSTIRCLFETSMSLKGSGLPEDLVMTNLIIRLCGPQKGVLHR
ncbi:MAG: DNA polymerase III subunit delta, partial [Thermodesulfobacteriota bacterium]